jgi:hypothetical protein
MTIFLFFESRCLDIGLFYHEKYARVSQGQVQLPVQLVRQNLFRIVFVLVSRVARGRLQWRLGPIARLSSHEHAYHFAHLSLRFARVALDQQIDCALLHAGQQLENMFEKLLLLSHSLDADCN